MEKVQVTQEHLYDYILAHGVKLSRLAELMDKTPSAVISCFLHHKNMQGTPRYFNAKAAEQLNNALPVVAQELRGLVLRFGTDQKFTNKHGRTYDPGLLEPLKQIGQYMNLTAMLERVLGWNEEKKKATCTRKTSKVYGNISESDAIAINTELLSVAAVLDSYEVIPSDSSSSSSSS